MAGQRALPDRAKETPLRKRFLITILFAYGTVQVRVRIDLLTLRGGRDHWAS